MHRNTISLLRVTVIALLGTVIGIYTIFQAWKLLQGPLIEVYTPQNGAMYNSTLIEIDGKAKNVAYVNLNDRPIFTDKNGRFSEKLLLSPGYNIIKLDAKDKFKKYTEKKIEVILKEY